MKKTAETLQNPILSDYRFDCWTGFKDVSLRLSHLDDGENFSFICSADQAPKMDRVIAFRKGRVRERRQNNEDVVFTVGK